MSDPVQRTSLDAPPSPDQIKTSRENAAEQDVSIELRFPTDSDSKRLVVSPRGTVVVLSDVSEETFHQSASAEEIAATFSS